MGMTADILLHTQLLPPTPVTYCYKDSLSVINETNLPNSKHYRSLIHIVHLSHAQDMHRISPSNQACHKKYLSRNIATLLFIPRLLSVTQNGSSLLLRWSQILPPLIASVGFIVGIPELLVESEYGSWHDVCNKKSVAIIHRRDWR